MSLFLFEVLQHIILIYVRAELQNGASMPKIKRQKEEDENGAKEENLCAKTRRLKDKEAWVL